MRKLSTLTILSLLMTQQSFAANNSKFEQIAKSVPTYNGKNAICYVDPKTKEAQGINTTEKVRLASTTKLITSYWAISKLGADFRFKTKFYFDPKTEELHISGQRDPLFGERRAFQIISELNKAGIFKISKLSFDNSFGFYRSVEAKEVRATEITQRGGVRPMVMVQTLADMFNVSGWSRDVEGRYRVTRNQAAQLGVEMIEESRVRMSVGTVEYKPISPMLNRVGIRSFESGSSDLKAYLKVMNRYSLNYPADEIFNFLGGAKKFADFIESDLGITENHMQIFAGSGLPNFETGSRRDGWSTCVTMVKVLSSMEKKLVQSGYALSDVLMVAGEDPGTLNGFYGNDSFKNSVLAKTGTLNNAIALSGVVNTEDGEVFFGVFFQTQSKSTGRAARDRAVIAIADKNGGPDGIKYQFKSEFVPFDDQSGLREANLIAGERLQ